jgi:glyoxylase-like metal-dependent hydrolase (beta-lactamase superfamily II)
VSLPNICVVVDTAQARVLVDTGGGTLGEPYGQDPGFPPVEVKLGGLMAGLDAEGIRPDSIDLVILTHTHPDHVGGMTDHTWHPAFPKARYVLVRGEWEELIAQQVPDDDSAWNGWAVAVRYAQRRCLAIQDRVQLIEFTEIEIAPGVRSIPTPGETPHHIAVEFASCSERLVCVGDALRNPFEFQHPDWGPQHAESIQKICQRISSTTLVHGYHFPFPGLGHVVPHGDTWDWQAL